jgi:hypothetical protein
VTREVTTKNLVVPVDAGHATQRKVEENWEEACRVGDPGTGAHEGEGPVGRGGVKTKR